MPLILIIFLACDRLLSLLFHCYWIYYTRNFWRHWKLKTTIQVMNVKWFDKIFIEILKYLWMTCLTYLFMDLQRRDNQSHIIASRTTFSSRNFPWYNFFCNDHFLCETHNHNTNYHQSTWPLNTYKVYTATDTLP